jgi:hypothetical protein
MNRFDICAAYYHFSRNFDPKFTGKMDRKALLDYQYRKYAQLLRMRYRPRLSDSTLATITPEAKCIYMSLVRKYLSR